ncbi:MAG TPA: FAD-dependent oxidoreductase [Candidatus Saccharimonadales bacterium]|nr:FAD-dependent oxidoreductase [Candidatus Saccharimonadales bacterium]
MANAKKTKILILGGGFGGLKTALELTKNSNFNVTLLSKHDDFRYYPALYEAATGGNLLAARIPLAEIFKDKPVNIIADTAKSLDRTKRKITGVSGKQYSYDVLIIALGVVTNYFGIKGLEKYSFGIKTVDEAEKLRDHIHKQLLDDGRPDLNYVVIGGGPTGIELAGALPAYIRHVARKHGLSERPLNIDLVEAAPRVTPRMPRPYSTAVQKRLRQLGIKLYLGQAVQAATADSLMVNDKPLDSHTVIWTAGVTNNPFFGQNKFEFGGHGKVKVNEFLQAEPDIYIIGDNADTEYSGMAQTALYDASFVADNLKRQLEGKQMRAYRAKKPIYVIPVGPDWAAVLWNRTHIYGRLGWVLRSAADLRGYRDYEPWWPASKHWVAEFETEKACQICAQ